MIYSFAPIVNDQSRILILGSMPSSRSLECLQYYGNPQNYFWTMLFSLFDEPFTDDYRLKQQLILRHHLALWDVLSCCERKGSLDGNITQEVPNDFRLFFATYPAIQTILFNGGKACQSFRKHFPDLYQSKACLQMPSTSPAYTMKREIKRIQWQKLLLLLAQIEPTEER